MPGRSAGGPKKKPKKAKRNPKSIKDNICHPAKRRVTGGRLNGSTKSNGSQLSCESEAVETALITETTQIRPIDDAVAVDSAAAVDGAAAVDDAAAVDGAVDDLPEENVYCFVYATRGNQYYENDAYHLEPLNMIYSDKELNVKYIRRSHPEEKPTQPTPNVMNPFDPNYAFTFKMPEPELPIVPPLSGFPAIFEEMMMKKRTRWALDPDECSSSQLTGTSGRGVSTESHELWPVGEIADERGIELEKAIQQMSLKCKEISIPPRLPVPRYVEIAAEIDTDEEASPSDTVTCRATFIVSRGVIAENTSFSVLTTNIRTSVHKSVLSAQEIIARGFVPEIIRRGTDGDITMNSPRPSTPPYPPIENLDVGNESELAERRPSRPRNKWSTTTTVKTSSPIRRASPRK